MDDSFSEIYDHPVLLLAVEMDQRQSEEEIYAL